MLTKIDSLAYKLQLLSIMRIHSIISIAQLELTAAIAARALNSYNKRINIESSLVYNEDDNDDNIKIKRIINKRITSGKPKYLLK